MDNDYTDNGTVLLIGVCSATYYFNEVCYKE